EQGQLYNAFNANIHYFTFQNLTINATGVATFWCPSDGKVDTASTLPPGDDGSVPVASVMRHNSYKGSAGTWFSPGRYNDPNCANFQALYGQANGMFFFYSAVKIADITDGTSNTIGLGEAAFGKLSAGDQQEWHWWTSGNYADTMFTTFYPLNPY